MFKSPQINWCALMDGNGKVNSYVKMFLASFKKAMPQLCHNCPYRGVYSARNISLPHEFLTFYPIGVFRFIANVYDDGNQIFKFQMDYTTV